MAPSEAVKMWLLDCLKICREPAACFTNNKFSAASIWSISRPKPPKERSQIGNLPVSGIFSFSVLDRSCHNFLKLQDHTFHMGQDSRSYDTIWARGEPLKFGGYNSDPPWPRCQNLKWVLHGRFLELDPHIRIYWYLRHLLRVTGQHVVLTCHIRLPRQHTSKGWGMAWGTWFGTCVLIWRMCTCHVITCYYVCWDWWHAVSFSQSMSP